MPGDVLQVGALPGRKNALGLRYQISQGDHRTSFLFFPICWGHQDVQSGLISRFNTLYMQLIGTLWRAVLIFSLLKTSLSHWTGIPSGCPLAATFCYLLFRKRKAKVEAILWSCRVLGAAWGKGSICLCFAHLSSFGPKELPHDGEVEASIFLSQKLETKVLFSKSAAEDMTEKSLLAICNLKSCVHIYKYICADGCPSSARQETPMFHGMQLQFSFQTKTVNGTTYFGLLWKAFCVKPLEISIRCFKCK